MAGHNKSAAHVILFGPSTAGKTSLMLGLSRLESSYYKFNVDKTWTTRIKRPGENDEENVFATKEEFNKERHTFLFPFQTYPTYEYGIKVPSPLKEREIRMRILMPVFALKFRSLVPEPTVFCAIYPYHNEPESIFTARDPDIDPGDLEARMQRFRNDTREAREYADIHFQNKEGLDKSTLTLHDSLVNHITQ